MSTEIRNFDIQSYEVKYIIFKYIQKEKNIKEFEATEPE